MSKSSIEWTGSTWNPIRARNRETGQVGTHCVKVSPGCLHCYAETHNGRNFPHGSSGLPYTQAGAAQAEYFLDPAILAEPLRRKKPERYFVCSMTDLFMYPAEWIAAVFGVMAACPQHVFQCLTKQPEAALAWYQWKSFAPCGHSDFEVRQCIGAMDRVLIDGAPLIDGAATLPVRRHVTYPPWPLPNVWLGVSVEDRRHGLPRIDILRQIPAALLRFLSIEPLLEDLGEIDLTGISWVICGGESGRKARPFDVRWARSIIAQCKAAGVPVFLKQLGAHPNDGGGPVRFSDFRTRSRKHGYPQEWPEVLRVREMP